MGLIIFHKNMNGQFVHNALSSHGHDLLKQIWNGGVLNKDRILRQTSSFKHIVNIVIQILIYSDICWNMLIYSDIFWYILGSGPVSRIGPSETVELVEKWPRYSIILHSFYIISSLCFPLYHISPWSRDGWAGLEMPPREQGLVPVRRVNWLRNGPVSRDWYQ